MHHFATFTAETLAVNRPGMAGLLKKEIPLLAFQHDYLMHCLLSMASLHIESLSPRNPLFNSKAVVMHHVNAISGFRQAIGALSPANSEPVLITSLFLLMIGCVDSSSNGDGQRWINAWLGLHCGIRAIIDQVSWQGVRSLTIGPIFSRGEEPAYLPVKLPMRLWSMLGMWDLSNPDAEVLTHGLLALGALYSLLLRGGCKDSELYLKVSSWPASLPPDFAALAKQARPEALIILAYFLMFSKMATTPGWWMEGISNRGIGAIDSVLDSHWDFLMQIPLQMVNISDPKEIEKLLLSEIPLGEEDVGVVYELPNRSRDPRFNTTNLADPAMLNHFESSELPDQELSKACTF
jgi:hypothetical protein